MRDDTSVATPRAMLATLLATMSSRSPAAIRVSPSTLPTVLAADKAVLLSMASVCLRVPMLRPPSAPKPDFLTIL